MFSESSYHRRPTTLELGDHPAPQSDSVSQLSTCKSPETTAQSSTTSSNWPSSSLPTPNLQKMRRNLVSINWRPVFRPLRPRVNRPFARAESSQASRIDRITARLPRRLQKYTNGLRNAPVSHIVSFLILHEITAIVPVIGLFGLFHYTNYIPLNYVSGHFEDYVQDGVARFERYFKRKGWFGFEQEDRKSLDASAGRDKGDEAIQRWHDGDGRYKVVVEVALAYAITKALLPVRIVASVWATPWFAGVLIKTKGLFNRKA